jgi:hypothetical protein
VDLAITRSVPAVTAEPAPPVRIANCSGFFGDRFDAAREMVDGGPIDYLTGDYLAELTMLILWRTQQKRGRGYAGTFLRQMEEVLGDCKDRGIKVVTNAGGLAPAQLADDVRTLAERLGLDLDVMHIEGDDVLGRLDEFMAAGHDLANLDTGQPLGERRAQAVTANAYLGAWGIVEALRAGADVVVCPRVTDASLVVGPAAFHHGWERTDWDRLAGAVVAGHIIECGAQATGGNYSFFTEVPGLERPGFPIAEVADDGSSIITKHPGTGGQVSVGTVTAQLLYEIAGVEYANPDAIARFDTIQLEQVAKDRVRVSGVLGLPAPPETKLAINFVGGYRNTVVLKLTGLDIEAKAGLAEDGLRAHFPVDELESLDVRLVRFDRPDAETNELATADLVLTAKSSDPELVGRRFANALVETVLANYPGYYTAAPPGEATLYGVYWPSLVPAELVTQRVVRGDGSTTEVVAGVSAVRQARPSTPNETAGAWQPLATNEHTRRVPLGTIVGARSGDKGGNANVGFWTRDEETYCWLERTLTIAELARLLPEAAELEIRRYCFPNIRALNFVIVGLLGEGVAASTRADPQAKSLGEFLRSRVLEVPEHLLR